MKYNQTSDKNGCIQVIESLTKLGFGGISDDSDLMLEITNYFNMSVREIAYELLKVDKRWRFDDQNYSDFPIASIDLLNNQRDYPIPPSSVGGEVSTFWKLNRVRVLGADGINYIQLKLADAESNEFPASITSGVPQTYRIIGKSIRLDPVPQTSAVTLAGGLEIQFQRTTSDFTVDDTTKQPGFTDAFHDIPCYKTAAKFLMPTNADLALSYDDPRPSGKGIAQGRMALMLSGYANQNDDVSNQITTRRKRFR